MRVLQHEAGGGRETTVSFGVALIRLNVKSALREGKINMKILDDGWKLTHMIADLNLITFLECHLLWVCRFLGFMK